MIYFLKYLMFSCSLFLLPCCSLVAKYHVAICAIFQNEAPYLKEWIEFHKLQGVEHFYLYDNLSEDNFSEVLKPYILSEQVTLISWPYTYDYGDHAKWIEIQCAAYMDCISNHREDVEWVAAIDVDEFLFCPDGQQLPVFLKKYKKYGGLCVNWLKFGTSNIDEIPEGVCLIEVLLNRSDSQIADNTFIKSIAQPRRVTDCTNPHFFIYKKPYFAVGSNKELIKHGRSVANDVSKIRINHYWTRNVQYFLEKKIGSRQKRRTKFTTDILMKMERECNLCRDTLILKFAEDLRKAMGFCIDAEEVSSKQ